MRKVGIVRLWLDLEDESGGESSMTTEGMAQEDAVGKEGVGDEQEPIGGDDSETVRTLNNRWPCESSFGMTVAGDEAGNLMFDEELVKLGEQVPETLVGPAALG